MCPCKGKRLKVKGRKKNWVSLNRLLYVFFYFTLLTLSSMYILRMSLNMDGGRGIQKRTLVGDVFRQKS